MNYVPWAIVGFIFQYHIRRKHFSWWTKYNCTCSSARRRAYSDHADVANFVFRRSVCCNGLWLGCLGHYHLFRPSIPYERNDRVDDCANVVGKYCVFENGGWTGAGLQADACERHVWVSFDGCLVHVVMAELVSSIQADDMVRLGKYYQVTCQSLMVYMHLNLYVCTRPRVIYSTCTAVWDVC